MKYILKYFTVFAVIAVIAASLADLSVSAAAKTPERMAKSSSAKFKGFKKLNGHYYYIKNKRLFKGFHKIKNKTYYFSNTGERQSGWQVIKGKKYYFAKNGVMRTGRVKIGKYYYFFDKNGRMKTGFRKVGNKTYYFDKKTGRMFKKYQKIGGKTYYFGSNGVMKKGIAKIGKSYYFFNGKGALVKSAGLKSYNGKKAYVKKNSKGKLLTSSFKTIKGKRYYFTSKAAAKTGYLKLKGKHYFFNKKGVRVYGFQKVGAKRYYFRKNAKFYAGFQTISGKRYYFKSGYVLTGLQNINGAKYYFNSEGVMQTGFQTIGGNRYYFESDGKMAVGEKNINGYDYYFGTDGVMKTGYVYIGDKLYYIEPTGIIRNKQGASLQGWISDDTGKKYYYTYNGYLVKGIIKISGLVYGFGSDGAQITGVYTDGLGNTYWFLGENGSALLGWYTQDDNKYYFGTDGIMRKGFNVIDKHLYYFEMSGVMYSAAIFPYGDQEYRVTEQGYITEYWYKSGSYTYYFDENGNMVTGTVEINNKVYVFDVNGRFISSDKRYFGIDVSYHNGTLNWAKIKAAGVDFAMIRAGYGMELNQKDKQFEANYRGAKAQGIMVGAYTYSYATTVAQAKKEAKVMLQWIKGKSFEYPIVFDIEDASQSKLSDKQRSAIVDAFCRIIQDAGYYVMVYANKSWLENNFLSSTTSKYDIWCAHWADKCGYKGDYGIWQYTSKGRIKGINCNFDFNYSYKNYPSIIKKKGLNNL